MSDNKPYTPTYDEVVTCFSEHASSLAADDNRRGDHGIHFPPEFASYVEAVNGFDRWIAAHDAQVARAALNGLAAEVSVDWNRQYNWIPGAIDEHRDTYYPEESPNA